MSVIIRYRPNALYELRSAPGVVAHEEAIAQEICDRANDIGKGTYATGSQQGMRRPQGRWRTTVVTADAKAMAHNAKHNVLIRSMP